MEITVLFFGKLAEITAQQEWKVDGLKDIDELRSLLDVKYPETKTMKYAVAVNNNIVAGNLEFNENATVALLPPFAGG
jgi:molybdopterin synthase sulfur carrier subunit